MRKQVPSYSENLSGGHRHSVPNDRSQSEHVIRSNHGFHIGQEEHDVVEKRPICIARAVARQDTRICRPAAPSSKSLPPTSTVLPILANSHAGAHRHVLGVPDTP
jgi:hypothetical protein